MSDLHVLAIFAHRDDAELTCAGTLIKLASQGYRTGILDLTAGEMGSRGSAELREAEASKAAAVMGLAVRENLGLPDAGIVNTPETRRLVTRVIRRHKPTIVIAPAQQGRHPDHRVTAELVRDACFISGLAKRVNERPDTFGGDRADRAELRWDENGIRYRIVLRKEDDEWRIDDIYIRPAPKEDDATKNGDVEGLDPLE